MGLAAFNRRRRELAALKAAEEARGQAEEKRPAQAEPARRRRKDKGGDQDGDQSG
ncbi:MAG: hypothetical protein FWJ65_06775 [Limnochordales bacterium]